MQYPENLEMPILFKIIKKQYMQDLLDGKLYMNNLRYFVDLEERTGEQGVGDKLEGALCNIQKHKLFIQYDGEEKREVEIGPPPGIIYDKNALQHPVFCMVGKIFTSEKIKEKEYLYKISLERELLNDFIGDDSDDDYCVVMVYNYFYFIDRVGKAINSAKLAGKADFISYRNMSLPNIVDGEWVLDNTFTKDNRFKNQSEYRIELFKECDKPFILEIGDISDIATVLSISQIEKELTILQRILE